MRNNFLKTFYELAVKDKQCFVCSYFSVDKTGKEWCHKLKVTDPSNFTINENYLGKKIQSKCNSKHFIPTNLHTTFNKQK